MAETPTTQTPFKFDVEAFTKHLNAIKEEQLEKYTGKHNHNPFKWIAENIRPLEDRLAKGERTEELYKAALNLKSVAPKINPAIPDEVADATPAIAQGSNAPQLPKGLNFGSKK